MGRSIYEIYDDVINKNKRDTGTSLGLSTTRSERSVNEIFDMMVNAGIIKQPEPTTARAVAPVNPVQNTSPIRDGLNIGSVMNSLQSEGLDATLNRLNPGRQQQRDYLSRAYGYISDKLGSAENPGLQDIDNVYKAINKDKLGASSDNLHVYAEAEKLLQNWLNENSDSKRELVNNTPLNTMQKAVDGKNPISNDPFGDDSWLHDDKLIAQYLDPAKGSDKYNTEGVDYGTAGMGEYEFFTKYRDGAIPASEENQKRYEELKNRLTGYINNRPDQNTDTVLYTDEYGDKINTADAMRIKAQQNLLSDIKASPEQAASSLSELFTGNRKSENAVAVNSEELKNAGWHASGNSIINYVKPYSNYEYNNAAVFSPVVMGEDGSVQRILSPEELEQYASDVLSGKRGDNLGLQVTETFEGNFAASLAQENAKRIRRLSERQYAGTDVNGEVYGNDDKAVEDMGIDVGEAVQYQKLLRDKATNALLTKYYSDISTASLEDANIPDWLKNAMKPYAGMAATAANIAASPLQAVEYIQNLSEGAEGLFKSGGNKLSAYLLPNVANDYVTNLSNTSTSAITEEIRSSIRGNGDSDFMNFLADTAANTYGGVSSGVQSTLVGLACKALLPPGIAEAVSLSTMSLQAAQNTYNEQIKNGSSVGKATAYSVLTGLNEYIGEKVSLENLFSIVDSQGKKTAKQVFLQMLGQSAIEGSEEVNTSLLNAIADNLVNGDQAEYYQNIQKYREQGYSEEEAKEKATAEFLNGLISDAWGGAIGGLLGGGMGNIANTAQRNKTANQAGQRVYQQGTMDELYKLAESMAEDKYVNNRLKSYDKVVQSYGNESAQAVKAAGDLYMAVQESNNTAVENSLTDERQKALEELYAKEIGTDTSDASVTPAAKILNKYISGEKLTAKEQRVLSTDASQNTLKAYKNVSNDIYKKAMERQSKAKANRTAANSLVAPKAKEYKADIDGYNVHTDDNKVYTADGSEQVDIEDIASVGKNDIQVVTSKGDTVSIKSLDMPKKTAMLFRAALDIQKALGVDLPPAIVSEIVNGCGDLNSDVSMSNYVIETAHAIANGYTNNNAAYNAKTSVLSESAYKAFYEQGRELAASHTKAQQRAVSARIKGAQTRTEGKVRFTDGLTQDSRTGSVYYSEDGKTYKGIGKAKQTGVDLMTKLAKALGFDVVFYRSTQTKKKGPYTSKYVTENNFAPKGADAPNGFWRNGTMYIDINAGMNGEGIILYTASHELVHMIREGSPEHFKALADFLVENYAEAGANVDDLVLKQKGENAKLNYDEAYEEVIARACEDFLRDTHINEKAKALYQQDRTLWEKIRDALKKILDSLKELMEKGGLYEKGSKSEAARLTARMGHKIVEQAHDLWIEGIQASAENLRNMEKAAGNGGAKLSIRKTQNMDYADQLEQIERQELNGSNSLYVGVTSTNLQSIGFSDAPFAMNQSDYRKARRKSGNNKHYSSHSVPYEFFEKLPEKLSDIGMAIDNGNKVTLVTDYVMNDTNGSKAFVIAGIWQNQPMESDTVNQIKSVYPLDDTVLQIQKAADESKLVVLDKNKAENMLTTIGVQPSEVSRILNLSKNSLSQSADKVKQQSRSDSSYLSAVNRGDMDTAQRMVDEAAKEAGYTIKAYHGTPNGTFTVFKGWQYFTQNKEYADIYQNQGASSNGYKLTADKPYTYGVYLSADNVFDTRQKKCRDIFMKEFYRKWGNGAPLSEKGLPDWTDGDDLVEFFEENDYDFDAILLDEGATGGYGDEVKSRGISYVIKDSSQIKSADPVTYDDKGNVIPLSERFNPEQKDIRYQSRDNRYLSAVKSGNMQEAQSLVDEAAEEAFAKSKIRGEDGKLIKVYHGTDEDFSVFDKTKGRPDMDIQGMFFTPYEDDAEGYGQNVRAFYLNIENPADFSTGYKALTNRRAENNAGVKARDDLERMGFDGVDNDGEEYIAFSSEQIKSADPVTYDDNGEVIPLSERFDSTKKDIRYQPRGGDIFDIDLFDDDSVENIFAREYATHHEDIGEVLRNISDIELTPAKVSGIVNRVLRDNLGMLDAEKRRTLSTELQLALENVDRTDPEAVSNEMIAAVRKAIDNAEITDEHNTDNYNDLRNAFKGKTYYLTDEQIADLEENDMTLNDFKRAMFGKINIAKKGNATRALSLKGLHDNLTYPDEYLPFNREQWDEYGYHAPIILMETFENLSNSRTAPISEMMSSEEMDDMAVNLTAKMTGAIVEAKYNAKYNAKNSQYQKNLSQKMQNQADEYIKLLVDNLKIQHENEIAEQKQRNKEKLEALKQKERERTETRLKELEDYYKELRSKNVTNRQRTQLRNGARKKIQQLDKLLNRSDKNKTVKQGMRQTVSKLLEVGDMLFPESRSLEKMAREGVADATPAEQKLLDKYIEYLDIRENTKTEKGRKNANAMLAQIRKALTDEKGVTVEVEENGKIVRKKMSVTARERMRYDNAVRAQNSTRLKYALQEVADAYSTIKEANEGYIRDAYDPVIIDQIDELRKEVGDILAKDMSYEQLETLNKILSRTIKSIQNANKQFMSEKSVTDSAKAVMTEVNDIRKLKDERNKIATAIGNIVFWNNLKPIYAFQFIGSDTLTEAFWNVQKGENIWYEDIEAARQFKAELDKKYRVGKLNTKKKSDFNYKKTAEFEALDGSKFVLNLNQMMDIYAASRRPQALQHLLRGGFTFAKNAKSKNGRIKVGAKVYQLTAETIDSIVSQLSVNEKAYVEEMQEYLSSVMADKGNEVSMQLHGVKLFNEEIYWSISSTDIYAPQSEQNQENKVNLVQKIRNAGFTKATVKNASNPIVLNGFEENWCSHVNEMSLYHAMTLPLEDLTKIINYRERGTDNATTTGVRGVINQAYGNSASAYLSTLLDDINGGIMAHTRTGGDKLISLAKKGAVLANLSVILQQPSAIFRAMAYVPARYFIMASGNKFWSFSDKKFSYQKHNEMYEELVKYAPIAGIKRMGSFDTGNGRGVMDYLASGGQKSLGQKAYEKIADDIPSKLPQLADEIAWVKLWQAIQHETRAKHGYKLGSEENKIKSGERFNEVVHRTQVYDSVLSRSQAMRSKQTYDKILTSFMAEPTTIMNMTIDAVVQSKRQGFIKGGGWKTASRTIAKGVGLSILANALLHAIPIAMRDKDEGETLEDKYMQAFWGDLRSAVNPMSYFPILRDVSSLIEGYSIDRMDMSLVSELIKTFRKTTEKFYEGSATADTVIDAITAVASLFGVPAKNLVRDIRSVINTAKTLNYKEYTLADDIGINGPLEYQKGYDNAWNNGYDEETCNKKGEEKARAYIKKVCYEKYLDALRNGDSETVKEIRRLMVDSGYYHSTKKGGTALSRVDEIIAGWRDKQKEADERAATAADRKK